jgi:glycosyltransferase involved in cell wall biosynthesis
MISSLDQRASADTSAEAATTSGASSQAPVPTRAPGVFLMINSLETGGTERQFAAIAKSLNPASFRVYLGCIQQRGPFLDGLGDVPQFRLGGSLYGVQSLRTRYRMARHLRHRNVAIAHAFDFYANMTLVPAAHLARTPVVIGSQRQLGDLLTSAQFRAQLAAFRWCDRVICNSHAAARPLVEHGLPQRKIVVIGNGLPPEAFLEAMPALPREPGMLRVGMIARMNAHYKNHRAFLRAAARLRGKFPKLEFVLVGDGPLRSEIERQTEELGLRDQVLFVGDRRDIPALLASMDISVVPSESESLSNVVLESMASGVPVVASSVGGNPELVSQERGALVPLNDDLALASALEHLLRDEALRAELAKNARQFAKAKFTLEHIQASYEALYADLLEQKQWRPKPVIPASKPGTTRIRVAVVAPTLRYVGGQAVQADLLLRHWQSDPDLDAGFIPVDPTLPWGLRWIARIPLVRTLLRQPLYFLALWRGLKDADIAHIFSASYWSFLLAPAPAWFIARLRGKKTIINYRSGEARDHLQRFRTARPILARADRLVVPSDYLVDVFKEFDLHAEVVPNIIDLEQFSFRERNPLRPHLVCTRGFHPYYCVDVVVRAFAEVKREFPEARLDLVGKGPLESEIRALVSSLKLSGVNFAGVASRQEIGRFYDQADIFINASYLDNMPVSILEAFASGTPVVTTAPESMRYLVDHERTGLLSEPGDPSALAKNVIRLLRDPVLASQLISNAHEESRRYQWTAVREQWLKVYRSLSYASHQPTD